MTAEEYLTAFPPRKPLLLPWGPIVFHVCYVGVDLTRDYQPWADCIPARMAAENRLDALRDDNRLGGSMRYGDKAFFECPAAAFLRMVLRGLGRVVASPA